MFQVKVKGEPMHWDFKTREDAEWFAMGLVVIYGYKKKDLEVEWIETKLSGSTGWQ